ncbi:MAG: peptidylprolyl isomerase [Bacteroidales bacterium]|uniref:peptidylprolyl isomerase n=1 Tax=Sodaliphilus sp. TaxID=2815818 RepID=UPI001B74F4AF|nr:peptidylprolyl isomerase [Candidatus Sodaliphilus limicaballi]
MKKVLLLAVVLCAALSCSMTNGNGSASDSNSNEKTDSTKMTQVEIKTSLGDIVVELYNETPKHRDNFIKLAKEGYYDGVLFHRVIKDFMVQTGDGKSKTAKKDDMLGAGDPGYTIPAEFVYPKYFHKKGALAAARTGDQVNPQRASSGSQFYIVTGQVYSEDQLHMIEQNMEYGMKQSLFQSLAMQHRQEIEEMQRNGDRAGLERLQNELIPQVEAEYAKNPAKLTQEQRQAYTTVGGTPHLDGQYTVFGEVVKGMDVVDKIQNVQTGVNDRPVDDVKVISMRVL